MVSCEKDPTHLSTVRHCYQQTVEALLDSNALATFPEISRADIQAFQEMYGSSAFVCRRPRCVFSTIGFESASQRDGHESKHQRQYRCAYTSCVSFAKGFANRKQLRKHNEMYHAAVTAGPSLAESLTAVVGITQQPPGPSLQQQQQQLQSLAAALAKARGQPASGNAMSEMLANMPLEQQQRLATLPPEKINELVTKWHEQRAMSAANGSLRQPQVPILANNQMRPGQQVPQPGQSSPASNALNQFIARQQQREQMQLKMQPSPPTERAPSRIQYDISLALKAQGTPRSGWQASIPLQERLAIIFNV